MDSIIEAESIYDVVMRVQTRLIMQEGIEEFGDPAVAWLLARQNPRLGSVYYPAVYHPTDRDSASRLRLVTGELPRTALLAHNAFELETARTLVQLARANREVRRAVDAVCERVARLCFGRICIKGECAGASVAWVRFLCVHDPERATPLACKLVGGLRERRDGRGRWNGFPTHYTLLLLCELPAEVAADELAYAFNSNCAAFRKPGRINEPYASVRHTILGKALDLG